MVVADNIPDVKTLRQKLRHEILVHHGLKAVVGDAEYQKIMQTIRRSRHSPHLRELWQHIEREYADFDALTQVEEVLAHAAEVERSTIQRWWDRIVDMIAHALRKVGLMRPSDMTKAEMNNIVQTLVERMKRVNLWDRETKAGTASGGNSSGPRLHTQGPIVPRVGAEADRDSVAPGKKGDQRTKLSQSSETSGYINALRKMMASLKSRVEPVKVSDTPEVLKALGVKDLPVYLSRDVVRKATNGVKENHDVPMDVIERLPALIADPIAVFRPKDEKIAQGGSKNLVIAAKTKGGKRVVVSLHVDKQLHRSLVNSIASAYGKPDYQYQNWMREGLLEYVKDKNPEWLRLQGLQLPKERSFLQGSFKKVRAKDELVKRGNVKFSASQRKANSFDEALQQPTPESRFKGVLNAVGYAVREAVGGSKGWVLLPCASWLTLPGILCRWPVSMWTPSTGC